ncbi:uncharacterized protein BO87DRAFT_381711 [Aspergillus neoniger CBS 115656]|uniref:Uncharacterized protein n=1 Tax=Aspergillus neoniger (strain CBS 115656) TaxID=1448310 RepID=A0A318ZVT6_ASPNB|nr:hypothetical protein BO87DRAFT_381711 [Aspergillus neoniger CBS 115656]PYH39662.1 hypothetical protein BO87DRAFT_381711 [Aspergillus neoniger CBS 115656]
MPTSQGTFRWTAPNRADAEFDIDGTSSRCVITLSRPVQDFGKTSATLDYEDIEQLSGTHFFDGHIGRADFETDFYNAPKIQGNLDSLIDQYIFVDGNGMWTHS